MAKYERCSFAEMREHKGRNYMEYETEQREKTDENRWKKHTDMSDDQRRKHQEMPHSKRRSFRR